MCHNFTNSFITISIYYKLFLFCRTSFLEVNFIAIFALSYFLFLSGIVLPNKFSILALLTKLKRKIRLASYSSSAHKAVSGIVFFLFLNKIFNQQCPRVKKKWQRMDQTFPFSRFASLPYGPTHLENYGPTTHSHCSTVGRTHSVEV
jgi:hypothetical protein